MIGKFKERLNKYSTVLILQIVGLFVVMQFRDRYIFELLISFLPWIAFILIPTTLIQFLVTVRKFKTEFNILSSLLVFLITLLFGILVISYYQTNNIQKPAEQNVKVVTLNVLWWNNKTDVLQNFFEEEEADILMLIEFTNVQYAELSDYLNDNYQYSNYDESIISDDYAGNVIFSKHKINSIDNNVVFDYYSGYAKVNIQINEYNYDFYAVHTSSPTTKAFFEERNRQLGVILNDIKDTAAERVVLAGDFNVTPWSFYYNEFSNNLHLKEIDVISAQFLPYCTWDSLGVELLPCTHIDHLYTTLNVPVSNFEVTEVTGTDHSALIFTI